MKAKYIVFSDDNKGEQIVIFGLNTEHVTISDILSKNHEVISAGFIKITVTEEPNGRSVSAKKCSRPVEDGWLLKILGGI